MLKVSFAAQRPEGAYALAIPVWSEDMSADRLAGLDEPARTLAARAAEAQRFEREAGGDRRDLRRRGRHARGGCCWSASAASATTRRSTSGSAAR